MAPLASNGAFEGRGLGCIRGERPVFAALDFRLEPGGALVLTGPNGSGKSSLLRVMAGLLPAAAGTLAWNGTPVDDAPELHRQRVHYLGHHDALKPVLTVAENLGFWASLRGANDDGVAAALARVGLDHLAETPGHLLSAGQRRRLSLARVLAAQAPLWLLDEPSVGLDAASVRTLAEVIAEHRANGGLVVVATHQALDLPDAACLAVDDYPPARPDPEDVW
ncbi:heme ABC exporter ATP-binding protein CcmA [Ferruginivarius sediminum]|uniref:heme ABC exporter ATP-binding protein CcmA n=1 Tax=Ferruginivarius sediminum TaxID=2661937 RepID=UPI0026B9ED03